MTGEGHWNTAAVMSRYTQQVAVNSFTQAEALSSLGLSFSSPASHTQALDL